MFFTYVLSFSMIISWSLNRACCRMHPNNEDLCKLRECIHLRLGPKALMKTRLNTNTQKNESVNRTLTKTDPRFGTWRRTLPGVIILRKFRIHNVFYVCFILFHDNFLIAESCTLQNCLSFLVFDQICSCHMIIISVLYIFQLNTQKNESVNRTLTKTDPRFGTWRRTLPGQIHGGVHMRNCGVSSSIQSRCKAVGAEIHSSLVKWQLKNIPGLYYLNYVFLIVIRKDFVFFEYNLEWSSSENSGSIMFFTYVLSFSMIISWSLNRACCRWEKHNLNNTIRERHMIFQTSLLRQTILPGIIYMWRF
jgi:hypothetical protein